MGCALTESAAPLLSIGRLPNLRELIIPDPGVIARLASKFEQRGDDECWPWLAGSAGTGYGMFWWDGKMRPAHRVVYQILVGPISGNLRHSCDNPNCVNPRHMQEGTQADNVKDAVLRGRIPTGTARKNTKLTEEQAREIKNARGMKTVENLAKVYGVTKYAIYGIWSGKNWRYL